MTPPLRHPTTADLKAHIHALAAAFNVRVFEAPGLRPDEAVCLGHLRAVLVAPVVDETTYAVDLHEIGHLLAPCGRLRTAATVTNQNLMRDEEDAAWTWARHNALVWTPVMEHVARWAEGTYQQAVESAPPAPVAPKSIDWNDWK